MPSCHQGGKGDISLTNSASTLITPAGIYAGRSTRTPAGEESGHHRMIHLRPLELTDAPAVFAAVDCSRDALRRWMVWYRDEYSLADAELWIQHTRAAREWNCPGN